MDRITLSDNQSMFEPLFNEMENDDCGCGCKGSGCGDNKNTNIITIHGQGAAQNQPRYNDFEQPRMQPVTHNTMMTAYPPSYPVQPSYPPVPNYGQQGHGFMPRIPERAYYDDTALRYMIQEVKNGLSRLTDEYKNSAQSDKNISKVIQEQQKLLRTLEHRAENIKYVEKKIPYYIDRPVLVPKKETEIKYVDRPVPVVQKVREYIDRPVVATQKVPEYIDRPVLVPKKEITYVDRPVSVVQKVREFLDRPVFVPKKETHYVDRPVSVPKKEIMYVDRPVIVPVQPTQIKTSVPKTPKTFQYREFA